MAFHSKQIKIHSVKNIFLLIFILHSINTRCQVSKLKDRKNNVYEFKHMFQLSLFPGISTNGIKSGSFRNDFSVNLFGGLSSGNRIFELGIITNVNFKSSTGIQISGLANVIGANAFVNLTDAEAFQLQKEKSHSSMQGIQVAGLLNYVLDTCGGFQISGVLNVVGDDFNGIQLAGLGNSSGGNMRGLQLSSLYNIAHRSISGIQLSTFFNYTDGELSGSQIALVNKSRKMGGRNSTPPTKARGLQIGLFNFCKGMNGTQVGLINFGGTARGKQIGLINFYSGGTPHEKDARSGTPIGLLNFNSSGSYYRIAHNEIFEVSIERTSGNCLNCSRVLGSAMPFTDNSQIYNENALIVGYDHLNRTWGFGYGFQKVLYNKASVAPNVDNKKRVITYGFKFLHLNNTLSLDKTFNLLNRLNFDFGKRVKSKYLFAGVSLNYFLHENTRDVEEYKIRSFIISSGQAFGYASNFWPGYEVGIQF